MKRAYAGLKKGGIVFESEDCGEQADLRDNAFTHTSGIHVDGDLKEIFTPRK